MQVLKVFFFDAAHYVPKYHGKCEALHGHTYKLVVKVKGTPDDEGMVLDYAVLKQIVRDNVLCLLDHTCLNDVIKVPTAENIAVFVWGKLHDLLKKEKYFLDEIEVWETPHNGCVYRGE